MSGKFPAICQVTNISFAGTINYKPIQNLYTMKNYNGGIELFKIKVLRTPIQNNPQGIDLIVLRPDFCAEHNLSSYGFITVKSEKRKQKEKTFFCFNNAETYKWVKDCAFFQNISIDNVCTNLMKRYLRLSFNAGVGRRDLIFD